MRCSLTGKRASGIPRWDCRKGRLPGEGDAGCDALASAQHGSHPLSDGVAPAQLRVAFVLRLGPPCRCLPARDVRVPPREVRRVASCVQGSDPSFRSARRSASARHRPAAAIRGHAPVQHGVGRRRRSAGRWRCQRMARAPPAGRCAARRAAARHGCRAAGSARASLTRGPFGEARRGAERTAAVGRLRGAVRRRGAGVDECVAGAERHRDRRRHRVATAPAG